MAFNIDRFKENINSFGYLRNNQFEVFVQTPQFMVGKNLNNNGAETSTYLLNDIMRYRIDQVRIPGVSLISNDMSVYGIGPRQKMPHNSQFHDTTFSILVDREANLWQFWYNWVRYIFEFSGEEPSSRNVDTGGKLPRYIAQYKDKYSSIMKIVVYNQNGDIAQSINLYEAFPSSVREIPLAWNDTSNLMRIAVSISYTYFTVEGSSVTSLQQYP